MAIKQLNPYLLFNGTGAQAVALYERALGAKTEVLTRYRDVPGSEPAPENANLVIHALLRIGDGSVIMISDTTPDRAVAGSGDNVSVCLDFSDPDDLMQKFRALAEGGKVTSPVQDTFWGAKFGTLTDAYGVNWMFNCTTKPA